MLKLRRNDTISFVMIYNDIKNFNQQFEYEPKIENKAALKKGIKKFVVAGMGGSHLAADIIQCWLPENDIIIWSDYGLPPLEPKEFKKRLIIASSYSGNTEETVNALRAGHAKKYPVAIAASAGKLIKIGRNQKIPYVALPHQDIQPRMALGWSMKAILALMNKSAELREASLLSKQLKPSHYEEPGKKLARKLKNSVPIIYASSRNSAIAKIWKIKLNETGKIPAFYNILPELNHNEMTGFDAKKSTRGLSRDFHFMFIRDNDDSPRIKKRMDVLGALYKKNGLKVEEIQIKGSSRLQKIFSSIILADWVSYYTAKLYNAEPEKVPMVEEFKKLIEK